MPILNAADYEMVRKAIDLRLDQDALPDSVIMLGIYQGSAEADVLRRDPHAFDYAPAGPSPDAVKWQAVVNAAAFLTAALIAPAIPQIAEEKWPDYQYAAVKVDWAQRAGELRGMAAEALASYLNADGYLAPLAAASACKKSHPKPWPLGVPRYDPWPGWWR